MDASIPTKVAAFLSSRSSKAHTSLSVICFMLLIVLTMRVFYIITLEEYYYFPE